MANGLEPAIRYSLFAIRYSLPATRHVHQPAVNRQVCRQTASVILV